MTDIVTIPDVLPISPYPALGSINFNNEAYAYATSVPPAVSRMREIAVACWTNATAAQERANSAAGSASAASGSASAAAGSESAASGSASAAAGSASSASTSASNAAASYTSMQKLYLGPKSSPPTTDNQGGALALGAWYVNTTLGSWFWWSGPVDGWKLGMSDVTGSFVPLAGGVNMSGFLGVPAGATGSQAPRASEVVPRASAYFGTAALMADAPAGTVGYYESETGGGADWPKVITTSIHAWLVETWSRSGVRSVQTATFVLSGNPASGTVWRRYQGQSGWSAWDLVIAGRTMMSPPVVVNVPSGTATYTLDPSLGSDHVVTINATCTFNLPTPRQLGDTVTAHVISAGAIRPIVFSSNVVLPKDGTGALLPFTQYSANAMLTLLFKALRPGQWECYYGGVH